MRYEQSLTWYGSVQHFSFCRNRNEFLGGQTQWLCGNLQKVTFFRVLLCCYVKHVDVISHEPRYDARRIIQSEIHSKLRLRERRYEVSIVRYTGVRLFIFVCSHDTKIRIITTFLQDLHILQPSVAGMSIVVQIRSRILEPNSCKWCHGKNLFGSMFECHLKWSCVQCHTISQVAHVPQSPTRQGCFPIYGPQLWRERAVSPNYKGHM